MIWGGCREEAGLGLPAIGPGPVELAQCGQCRAMAGVFHRRAGRQQVGTGSQLWTDGRDFASTKEFLPVAARHRPSSTALTYLSPEQTAPCHPSLRPQHFAALQEGPA